MAIFCLQLIFLIASSHRLTDERMFFFYSYYHGIFEISHSSLVNCLSTLWVCFSSYFAAQWPFIKLKIRVIFEKKNKKQNCNDKFPGFIPHRRFFKFFLKPDSEPIMQSKSLHTFRWNKWHFWNNGSKWIHTVYFVHSKVTQLLNSNQIYNIWWKGGFYIGFLTTIEYWL